MGGATILISPLNWGFGHAGRMIPLALELQKRGNELIFGADAGLLPLIEKELPGIKLVEIPGLRIRYSRCLPQYVSIFLQLPLVVLHAVREHYILIRLAKQLKPSVIISDNRFGFFHREIFSVYITHQVRIPFPRLLRFMEPVAAWLHRMIIRRYDLCLVPDYPGPVNLSGRLSHDLKLPDNVHFTGPLSRFRMPGNHSELRMPENRSELRAPGNRSESGITTALQGFGTPPGLQGLRTPGNRSEFGRPADLSGSSMPAATSGHTIPEQPEDIITPTEPYCCLILSGPEPQHSLLLEKVTAALRGLRLFVLSATPVQTARKSEPGITFLIKPDTETMRHIIKDSSLVITRAGYTSVMELSSLGKGAVLIPAPGQPEQEYLGDYLNGHHGFVSVRQDKINSLIQFASAAASDTGNILTDLVRVIESAALPLAGSIQLPENSPSPLAGSMQLPDNYSSPLAGSIQLPDNSSSPFPDSTQLFEKAINLLFEQNKE